MKRFQVELTLTGTEGYLEWDQVFPDHGPVEIEVGCGKGRFLIDRAAELQDRNFLGIEYANAYFQTIAKRSASRGLNNVRVCRDEAFDFFCNHIPDSSLGGFHLLYPDPWPKKRHNKRRLIRFEFLSELRRTLQEGAVINIATDHRDYFDWMCEQFDRWKGTFILERTVAATRAELDKVEARTNYEEKFIREGRPLHFIRGYRSGF